MQDSQDWQNKFQQCYCASKLLNKIQLLNKKFVNSKINLMHIKKSIYYANKYNGKRTKAAGGLHYCHPLELAYMAVDYLFETDIIIAVILQNMILDQLMTQQELSVVFNPKIANCLKGIADIQNKKNNNFIDDIKLLQKKNKCCVLFVVCINKLYSLYSLHALPEEVHKYLLLESLQAVQILANYAQKDQIKKNIFAEKCIPILPKLKC